MRKYNFAAKTTDNPDRFILHLSRTAITCEQLLAQNKPADMFYSENQVTVLSQDGRSTIQFDLDQATNTVISVYNVQGQKVISDISLQAFKDKTILDLPGNAAGIYIITVNLGGNQVVTKKVFVSH